MIFSDTDSLDGNSSLIAFVADFGNALPPVLSYFLHLLVLVAIAFSATVLLTRFVLAYLRKKQILDRPNERSNHTLPIPRGGGVAFIAVILLFWLDLGNFSGYAYLLTPVILGGLLLAAISFLDDKHGLPVLVRVGVQLAAIALGLYTLYFYGEETRIFPNTIPLAVEIIFVAVAWLWFINLYNFMDGIDGITSVETIAICSGLIFITFNISVEESTEFFRLTDSLSAVTLGAMLGFLWWNWHPAKIFSGDVGSVPLGFLLGFLLIQLAQSGHLVEALILPLYYLVDSTYTLLKRLLQGKKIWEAHSEHFYQQAVRQRGKTHSQVAWIISGLNLVLIGLVMASNLIGFSSLIALVISLLAVIMVIRTQLKS